MRLKLVVIVDTDAPVFGQALADPRLSRAAAADVAPRDKQLWMVERDFT